MKRTRMAVSILVLVFVVMFVGCKKAEPPSPIVKMMENAGSGEVSKTLPDEVELRSTIGSISTQGSSYRSQEKVHRGEGVQPAGELERHDRGPCVCERLLARHGNSAEDGRQKVLR